ncbi:MAG: hypothetical protein R3293_27420, partial [Candidatus Promineifilaceae bacterium]|nr:hypothetical protein [Candidatus Promineifilaceae bacterium]
LRKEDLLDGDELTDEKLNEYEPKFPSVFKLGLHNTVKEQLNTEGICRDLAVKTIEFVLALQEKRKDSSKTLEDELEALRPNFPRVYRFGLQDIFVERSGIDREQIRNEEGNEDSKNAEEPGAG